jgi:hypothetical protein
VPIIANIAIAGNFSFFVPASGSTSTWGWAALSPGGPSLALAAIGGVVVIAGQAWSAARFLFPRFAESGAPLRQVS